MSNVIPQAVLPKHGLGNYLPKTPAGVFSFFIESSNNKVMYNEILLYHHTNLLCE